MFDACLATVSAVADEREAWVELPSRELLRQFGVAEHHGFIPAMFRLVAAHPGIAPKFAALSDAVMARPGALTRAEREMVAAVTAAAQDCFY